MRRRSSRHNNPPVGPDGFTVVQEAEHACSNRTYDPQCGLCRRAHEWLREQPKLIELVFNSCKSEEARRRYPQLDHELTQKDLTLVSDDGAIIFRSQGLAHGFVGAHFGIATGPIALSSPELLQLRSVCFTSLSESLPDRTSGRSLEITQWLIFGKEVNQDAEGDQTKGSSWQRLCKCLRAGI